MFLGLHTPFCLGSSQYKAASSDTHLAEVMETRNKTILLDSGKENKPKGVQRAFFGAPRKSSSDFIGLRAVT